MNGPEAIRSIGILGGTGPFGTGFAARAAHLGYQVVIGSRDPARAAKVAAGLGVRGVCGGANRQAAADSDLIVITVPYAAHQAVIASVAALIAGRVLLDVTVPFDASAPGWLAAPERAFAAEAQEAAPGARVVAGFHTVAASRLRRVERPLDQDVLVCGDDPAATSLVGRIVEQAGGRPVDCGPLSAARVLEGLGAVITGLATRRRRAVGVRLTGW